MDYRREIDGLRALAVLPVILFHAGVETFCGGFVGVDVFFVISGYLITTIILAELEQDRFSIVSFYERRARRILPALFFVMLVCIPFAWSWLLPSDMKDFSHSIVAVSIFASNILFWRESGYFDAAAEIKPLLHTWSLAVEEQYYVLFPLFLMLFWRLGKRWILITLGFVFVASLAVSQWAAHAKPSAAFYLLPTRGWELLIGSFAAFYLSKANRKEFGKGFSEFGGWLGVALILYSVFTYRKATPFPGLYALVPTLGAVLIILFATQQTTVGKFVGNKAFVGVGLISYSAYLWHQPLFAFARHRSLTEPSYIIFLALSVLALALAYFSWRYVESPFRNQAKFPGKLIFLIGFAGSVFFISFGLVGHFFDGYKSRIPSDVRKLEKPKRGEVEACGGDHSNEPCYLGDKEISPGIAIVGDSHTNVIRKYFSERLALVRASALSYGKGWCAPLLDVGTNTPLKNPICRNFIDNAFDRIISDSSIHTVILHAEWSNYTTGRRWGEKVAAYYTDRDSSVASMTENSAVVRRGLTRTIDRLLNSQKRVIFVKSVPEYETLIPKFLAKRRWLNGEISLGSFSVNDQSYISRNQEFDNIVSEIFPIPGVEIIDTFSVFCPNKNACLSLVDDEVLYVDDNHLSYEGSRLLVDEIFKKLQFK